MHHLLQFPVGDLVAMEIWAQLKPAVSDALMDENSTLAVSRQQIRGIAGRHVPL